MAIVTALVNKRPVVIFSKSSCCMCYTIKTLISSFGANATVYELDEHPEGKQIEKELRGLGCKPSVPAVFIGETLIGGAKEIMSLHLKGQLVQLLLKANLTLYGFSQTYSRLPSSYIIIEIGTMLTQLQIAV